MLRSAYNWIFPSQIAGKLFVLGLILAWLGGVTQRDCRAAEGLLNGYADPAEFEKQIAELAKLPRVKVTSLAKTKGGRDVWLITLGTEAVADKPAILIIGNVEPGHLVGSEAALLMARAWATAAEKTGTDKVAAKADPPASDLDQAAATLLDKVTIYLIPRPSPDATAKNWKTPLALPAGNDRVTDDDRDGRGGEDPADDLNGDGLITLMRVADPQGKYVPHPDDPRILVEANVKKNERGAFSIYPEGRDDDRDEQFNEDGSGGVGFNRNFTHKYPFFKSNAGPHQVSEPETRAVADFCFDHPNIAAVLNFTPEENLFHPWKPGQDGGRIKTTLAGGDGPPTEFIAEHYRELHTGKEPPPAAAGAGSFSDWAYYHYGRWSFAARGWWIPPVEKKVEKKEEPKVEKTEAKQDEKPADPKPDPKPVEPKPETKKTPDPREAEQLNALRWLAQENIAGFVDWKRVEHPDFPGKTVEVGGFHPLVRLNPPAKELAGIAAKHSRFVEWLGGLLPRVEVIEPRVESLGSGLFRIRLKVANTGYLPTMSEMGATTRAVAPLTYEWTLPEGTVWLQGTPRGTVERLTGLTGQTELEWLVRVPGDKPIAADFLVSSPSVGRTATKVELK